MAKHEVKWRGLSGVGVIVVKVEHAIQGANKADNYPSGFSREDEIEELGD